MCNEFIGRNLPDLAFDASPYTGESLYYDGRFQGPIGGTSLSSPIFAAGLTVIDVDELSTHGGSLRVFVEKKNVPEQSVLDYLAAEKHLAAWVERNREHQAELQERLQEAALPCDLLATIQIAKWVYEQTEKANGQVWVMEKVLQHLGPGWSQYFAA